MFEWLNRHKKSIMMSTLYLVVPSFVLLYGYGECAKPQLVRWVAKVNGEAIPENQWQNAIENLDRRMKQYGMADLSRDDLERQALESAIMETLYRQKAQEWGITSTDQEVALHILSMPEFQNESQQFDKDRYYSLLASVGYLPGQFEEQQRDALTVAKLRSVVQSAYYQAKSEKERMENRQAEKASIEYLAFQPSSYTSEVEVDEPGMAAYFEANQEDFKKPEQRRIAYVKFLPADYRQAVNNLVNDPASFQRLVNRHFEKNPQQYEIPEQARVEYITYAAEQFMNDAVVADDEAKDYFEENQSAYKKKPRVKVRYVAQPLAALADNVDVTDEAVAEYYETNKARYTHGEQAKARHILMRVDPGSDAAKEEEVKQKLIDLRKKIEDGEYSFEEAAKQFSDDPVSAEQGGDLGYFGRGRMVPPFEKAVYELPLGQMSEPVKTQFGYHVILVDDRKEEGTDPLEDVQDEIKETLQKQRAVANFRKMSDDFQSLDAVPPMNDSGASLSVQTTDWFSRGDNVPNIPQRDGFYFTSSAFAQIPGKKLIFSGNTLTDNLYLIEPIEQEAEALMTFDEAKDQVVEELKKTKADELAALAATADAARIKTASESLEVIAQERGLQIQVSDLFSQQDAMVPGFGSRPTQIVSSAMTMALGQTDGPFQTSTGQHIIRLLAREPAHIPEFDEVSDEVERDFILARMQIQAKAAANAFADELYRNEQSLSVGASAAGVEVAQTELFPQGALIPSLGYKQAVNAGAFQLEKVGSISMAIDQPMGFAQPGQNSQTEAFYVIELQEIKEPFIPELDEVRDEVENAYKLVLAANIAQERAGAALEKVKSKLALNQPVSATQVIDLQEFEDQGDADNSEAAYTKTEITGSGSVTGIGRAVTFTKTVMALEPGKVSGLVLNHQIKTNEDGIQKQGPLTGVYIIHVLEKSKEEIAEGQQQFSLAGYMEQQAQMRSFSAWIEEVSSTAMIHYNEDIFATVDEENAEEMTESS